MDRHGKPQLPCRAFFWRVLRDTEWIKDLVERLVGEGLNIWVPNRNVNHVVPPTTSSNWFWQLLRVPSSQVAGLQQRPRALRPGDLHQGVRPSPARPRQGGAIPGGVFFTARIGLTLILTDIFGAARCFWLIVLVLIELLLCLQALLALPSLALATVDTDLCLGTWVAGVDS